jgi:hypothetical protein
LPLQEGTISTSGIAFGSLLIPLELSKKIGIPETKGTGGYCDISNKKKPFLSTLIYSYIPRLSISIEDMKRTFSDTFFTVVKLKSRKI